MRCTFCGRTTNPTPHDAHQIFASPCVKRRLAVMGPCVHLGNQLRTEQCPTCSGSVKVKVFACALHGECELANKLPDVKRCGSCGDFQAS